MYICKAGTAFEHLLPEETRLNLFRHNTIQVESHLVFNIHTLINVCTLINLQLNSRFRHALRTYLPQNQNIITKRIETSFLIILVPNNLALFIQRGCAQVRKLIVLVTIVKILIYYEKYQKRQNYCGLFRIRILLGFSIKLLLENPIVSVFQKT